MKFDEEQQAVVVDLPFSEFRKKAQGVDTFTWHKLAQRGNECVHIRELLCQVMYRDTPLTEALIATCLSLSQANQDLSNNLSEVLRTGKLPQP